MLRKYKISEESDWSGALPMQEDMWRNIQTFDSSGLRFVECFNPDKAEQLNKDKAQRLVQDKIDEEKKLIDKQKRLENQAEQLRAREASKSWALEKQKMNAEEYMRKIAASGETMEDILA